MERTGTTSTVVLCGDYSRLTGANGLTGPLWSGATARSLHIGECYSVLAGIGEFEVVGSHGAFIHGAEIMGNGFEFQCLVGRCGFGLRKSAGSESEEGSRKQNVFHSIDEIPGLGKLMQLAAVVGCIAAIVLYGALDFQLHSLTIVGNEDGLFEISGAAGSIVNGFDF